MTGRSACPECGTILRIRDRSFVGRKVSCPECKASLRIESTDGKGQYVAQRLNSVQSIAATKQQVAARPAARTESLPKPTLRQSISRLIYSPLTAAWLLAIALTALIGVLTLTPKFRFASARPGVTRPQPLAPVESQPASERPSVTIAPEPVAPQNAAVEVVSPIEVESVPLSALEPANLEDPLPWPPKPTTTEITSKPAVPEPKPPLTIGEKLAQKFTQYRQPKIRIRDLLETLEEQLDAKIRYDSEDLGNDSLDQTVSFELKETTLGEVIRTVANLANWELTIEDNGIRLARQSNKPER